MFQHNMSTPERGLPTSRTPSADTDREPNLTSAPLRVLLVEDYAPNILVAQTFLEQFGYLCDVATSGKDALVAIEANAYAAVVMDVQMPGMSGLEATKLIREREHRHGLPRLPIIGMTAHALPGDRERCLSSGMDDYLTKPFNPPDLENKLLLLAGPANQA